MGDSPGEIIKINSIIYEFVKTIIIIITLFEEIKSIPKITNYLLIMNI